VLRVAGKRPHDFKTVSILARLLSDGGVIGKRHDGSSNPIMAIAEILCALKDRDGHIRIPGFYDRVQPPAAKELGISLAHPAVQQVAGCGKSMVNDAYRALVVSSPPLATKVCCIAATRSMTWGLPGFR
jgi:hypothetical protein